MDQASALDQKKYTLNAVQIELEARAQDCSAPAIQIRVPREHVARTTTHSQLHDPCKLLAENSKGNLTMSNTVCKKYLLGGNDLLNLINDILDISKVEAGKLELVPEDVSLKRLGDSLQMTFNLWLNKKLEFISHVDADITKTINTDQQRLEQILKIFFQRAQITDKVKLNLAS